MLQCYIITYNFFCFLDPSSFSDLFFSRIEGSRYYKCLKCSKEFTRKDSLQRHIEKHRDIREVYSCNVCPSTFSRKDNLQKHEKVVHGIRGRRGRDLYYIWSCLTVANSLFKRLPLNRLPFNRTSALTGQNVFLSQCKDTHELAASCWTFRLQQKRLHIFLIQCQKFQLQTWDFSYNHVLWIKKCTYWIKNLETVYQVLP